MKKILLSLSVIFSTCLGFAQKPIFDLLNPTNHSLLLIDHEGQLAFGTHRISTTELRNNTGLVAGASKIINIPTVVTTVAEKSFSGPVFPEIQEFYPVSTSGYIDRTTMNNWEDEKAHKAISGKGKKKIVMTSLWTSVWIVGPVLSAISGGYDV